MHTTQASAARDGKQRGGFPKPVPRMKLAVFSGSLPRMFAVPEP